MQICYHVTESFRGVDVGTLLSFAATARAHMQVHEKSCFEKDNRGQLRGTEILGAESKSLSHSSHRPRLLILFRPPSPAPQQHRSCQASIKSDRQHLLQSETGTDVASDTRVRPSKSWKTKHPIRWTVTTASLLFFSFHHMTSAAMSMDQNILVVGSMQNADAFQDAVLRLKAQQGGQSQVRAEMVDRILDQGELNLSFFFLSDGGC